MKADVSALSVTDVSGLYNLTDEEFSLGRSKFLQFGLQPQDPGVSL